MSPLQRSLETAGKKFGRPLQLTCELPSLAFPPVSERKHGEVCMAIRRKNGGFLLQTKRSYPDSVMRLPTGGIKENEDIEKALMREIWEETNLEVRVDRFVADLSYRADGDATPFRTYMFACEEVSGELQSNDPSEGITAWVEAKPEQLAHYASELRRITPSWSNWGEFRAQAIDVLAKHYASLRA